MVLKRGIRITGVLFHFNVDYEEFKIITNYFLKIGEMTTEVETTAKMSEDWNLELQLWPDIQTLASFTGNQDESVKCYSQLLVHMEMKAIILNQAKREILIYSKIGVKRELYEYCGPSDKEISGWEIKSNKVWILTRNESN